MAMTPMRKCVQDIIDMADTGLSLEELGGMKKRIAEYLVGVPKAQKIAARQKLIDTMKHASATVTMKTEASDLLEHAVSHVELMGD